jgi:hypothetical protein
VLSKRAHLMGVSPFGNLAARFTTGRLFLAL